MQAARGAYLEEYAQLRVDVDLRGHVVSAADGRARKQASTHLLSILLRHTLDPSVPPFVTSVPDTAQRALQEQESTSLPSTVRQRHKLLLLLLAPFIVQHACLHQSPPLFASPCFDRSPRSC
eukprot:416090-Rhodomonas_salina.2